MQHLIELNLTDLKAALLFARVDAGRPYLNGVNLRSTTGKLTIEATDGRRLIQIFRPSQGEFDFIIPSDVLKKVRLVKSHDIVVLSKEAECLKLNYAGITYESKVLDMAYPDCDRLFWESEQDAIQSLSLNPELLNTFAQVNKLMGYKHGVTLSFIGNHTYVKPYNIEAPAYRGIVVNLR